MTLTADVWNAILALDSYNRGYGIPEGFTSLPTNILGDYSVATNSAILGTNTSGTLVDYSASFFAQSYISPGGQIVIAYRGTDNSISDGWWGLGLGAGFPEATRAELAVAFYALINDDSTTSNPNITLTGHSLGGGLAGYVGSILGESFELFDNMAFERAVASLLTGSDPLYQELRELYFGAPSARPLPTFPADYAYAVSGEFLQFNRALQSTDVTYLETDTSLLDIDPGQRHSQALLTVLLFGRDEVEASDWLSLRQYFVPRLFDASIASAVGEINATNMLTKIAYSAIDEGVRPFGDAAIRAMFDDVGDLARAVSAGNLNGGLTTSASKTALSEIIVQYAADLAARMILAVPARSGTLTLSTGTLKIDLDPNKFAASFNRGGLENAPTGQSKIIGVADLVDSIRTDLVLHDLFGGTGQILNNAFSQWSASQTKVTRIEASVAGQGTTIDATDAPEAFDESAGGAILVGGTGDTTFYSGGGNDLIFGGAGNDTYYGEQTATHAAGTVTFFGGGGYDVADYTGLDEPVTITLGATVGGQTINSTRQDLTATVTLSTGEVDTLVDVEKITDTGKGDTLLLKPGASEYFGRQSGAGPMLRAAAMPAGGGSQDDYIDLGSKGGEALGIIDASDLPGPLKFDLKGGNDVGTVTDKAGDYIEVKDVQHVIATGQDDLVKMSGVDDAFVEGGAGDDTIIVTGGKGGQIFGGAGNDTINAEQPGIQITGGAGKDTFEFSRGALVTDATGEDRLDFYNYSPVLAITFKGSEAKWAYALGGLIKIGFDTAGEMVVAVDMASNDNAMVDRRLLA